MRRVPLAWAPLLIAYLCVGAVPYLLGLSSARVAYRSAFTEVVTLASMLGMALLLLQFALSGRIATISGIVGADHGARLHRRVGEILAIIFFLHPLLIVLPRVEVSRSYAPDDLWIMFTGPLTDTGVYAWSVLIFWVLMAMFRDRLRMSYEAWRVSHGLGAVAIAVLATDHVITVGRHGYYPEDEWLDWIWIGSCAVAVTALLHTYVLRPLRIARRQFTVGSIERASRSDWCLTLRQRSGAPFDFKAGQFVWLHTGGSAFARREHPFSIASGTAALPDLSFIIREQGDYTSRLSALRPGQAAFLEGPQGEFTLREHSKAKGIGLIATGAGIAPIIGLLRELRDRGDRRPVRLVYGNRTLDQMVFRDEIEAMSMSLDFRAVYAVTQAPPEFDGHAGRIDADLLQRVFDMTDRDEWDHYVCGSAQSVDSLVTALREIGIPRGRIVHEQLAL